MDDSKYWDYKVRSAVKKDLGHTCRQCKAPFKSLSESIAIARGGRIELKYHETCFSGNADPRSQLNDKNGKWKDRMKNSKAPELHFNKMRTSSHW